MFHYLIQSDKCRFVLSNGYGFGTFFRADGGDVNVVVAVSGGVDRCPCAITADSRVRPQSAVVRTGDDPLWAGSGTDC